MKANGKSTEETEKEVEEDSSMGFVVALLVDKRGKLLTEKDFDMVRRTIVNSLEAKGYAVTFSLGDLRSVYYPTTKASHPMLRSIHDVKSFKPH